MPVSTRGARSRLRVVNDLGELHDAMDAEDDELKVTIKTEVEKSAHTHGSDSDSVDPAGSVSEDEEEGMTSTTTNLLMR